MLVKIDAFGNEQWRKTYGYSSTNDYANDLIQTSDGGYVIAGTTFAVGGGCLLFKTDSAGNAQWRVQHGADNIYYIRDGYSIVETSDGGYAIVGTGSYLLKTNSTGNQEWTKVYKNTTPDGTTNTGVFYSVIQNTDGGYTIVGSTTLPHLSSNADGWLIRTDFAGNVLWNKTFGGLTSDILYSVIHTSDGGYALAGYTSSFGAGANDGWFIKIDFAGNTQYTRTFGGAANDNFQSITQTTDGGYALAGSTESYGNGGSNAWLVKIPADSVNPPKIGFNVLNGGSGYTTPAIILSGGGGTGATATSRVSNGKIMGIVLTDPGTGYTSAPSIRVIDPNPRARGAIVIVTFGP